ncbi:hypothetical protein PAPYR_12952 [Paratrimastix pyriformis]|uniref:Uncharacterized protein n=1 Tax=Paratrimastix pyriformis TaxID=342808 RepID=A0ABQ8U4L5_9EUKA|nr:hypothetical protein PAPYR_12952 [Paratrimastix pyriformis]
MDVAGRSRVRDKLEEIFAKGLANLQNLYKLTLNSHSPFKFGASRSELPAGDLDQTPSPPPTPTMTLPLRLHPESGVLAFIAVGISPSPVAGVSSA